MKLNTAALDARVKRARSATGQGIRYKLGRGGFDPSLPLPTADDLCDCSGFAAWCLGMRRDQIDARKPWSKLLPWIETTMVYRDATGPQRVFVRLPKAVPGCLCVYGDRGGSEGHIGVVTRVYPSGFYDVVDCASSSSRRFGDAILERGGGVFLDNPRTIFATLRQDVIS